MRVKKHSCSLPIANHDVLVGEERPKRHSELLPDSIRCLIVGRSNCGKSNLMLCLLTHKNGLKFENIYVYSKTLHQPKYQYLEKLIKPMKDIGYFPYSNNEEITDNPKENSIFIFDDIACENHEKVRKYFSMGRHHGVCSFLLCQSYVRCPRHLVRDNANLIILFRQDDISLKHVYQEHVGSELSWPQFKHLCATCWKDPHGFITINKDDCSYRKGLDHFFVLDDHQPLVKHKPSLEKKKIQETVNKGERKANKLKTQPR